MFGDGVLGQPWAARVDYDRMNGDEVFSTEKLRMRVDDFEVL
jgi:hypothetical protein